MSLEYEKRLQSYKEASIVGRDNFLYHLDPEIYDLVKEELSNQSLFTLPSLHAALENFHKEKVILAKWGV